MSGENTTGYLQEIRGDLDGPACTVCGAIMVPINPCNCNTEGPCWVGHDKFWRCLSCGETSK